MLSFDGSRARNPTTLVGQLAPGKALWDRILVLRACRNGRASLRCSRDEITTCFCFKILRSLWLVSSLPGSPWSSLAYRRVADRIPSALPLTNHWRCIGNRDCVFESLCLPIAKDLPPKFSSLLTGVPHIFSGFSRNLTALRVERSPRG